MLWELKYVFSDEADGANWENAPVSPPHRWSTPQFPRSKTRRWSPTAVWSCPHGCPPRSPPRSSWGSCSGPSCSGCTFGWNARTSASSAPSPRVPSAAPARRRRRPRRGGRWRWTAPAAGTSRCPRLSDRSRSSSRFDMPLCCCCHRGEAALTDLWHGALE